MNKEEKMLLSKFKTIANKKWIKGINNSTGSVGMTFEKEIGKKPDKDYVPDFYGYELKCTTRYSGYPVSLFSCTFDGPTFPEINRIVERYGYYHKSFTDKKVLYTRVKFNKTTEVNQKYKFIFKNDKQNERIYLLVYDMEDNLIDSESYVNYITIYNHLCTKLNKMALIYASKKKVNSDYYYRYYHIIIYYLRDFDTFINLLENDYINVRIESRINNVGKDAGKYANKNLVFSIDKNKIDKLFDKKIDYNNDENNANNFFIFPI